MNRLRRMPRYAPLVEAMDSYAERLLLVKASGDHSTLDEVRRWVEEALDAGAGAGRLLVVVDYLQKIPVPRTTLEPETEVTTYLTQGLKEMAMSLGIQVIAIAASDRLGLKAQAHAPVRSARQLGAAVRGRHRPDPEQQVRHPEPRAHGLQRRQAQTPMRNWVVMSVEKNRAGRNAVDMEYQLDAAHFRMVPQGDFVRERLVDEKITLE